MDKKALLDRAAKNGEERMLFARILDKAEQCATRNMPTCTGFLSPAEAASASDLLRAAKLTRFALCGGYDGAERKMLVFLPDWQDEPDTEDAISYLRATFHESTPLTHRDLLGSLMALGIVREKLGDILVSVTSADLIVTREIAPYLMDNWTSAGRAALHIAQIENAQLNIPPQRVRELRDTVATLRLDAVTAVGFSMSRAKASELIASGRVQKNYRETTKGDAPVAEGDIISARGLGKFEVTEVGGLSKKGRTGILLRRYL